VTGRLHFRPLRRERGPACVIASASLRTLRTAASIARAGVFAAALAAPLATPAIARAEPTEAELTQARERFKTARKLEDAGKWAEALEQLQRVAEVKTTPQVRFHIALCMENMGRLTEALDGFAQAASEAGTSAPDVVKESREHIKKLEDTIPTVSVGVAGAAAGDALYLDRRRIPIDERPLALRADPGPHSAEVRRGDAVVARELFTLEPRSVRRVELRVGSVAPLPGEAAKKPGDGSKPPSSGSTQRALGWAAVGLGAASAIATGVFIGLRAGALDRLEAACPAMTRCSPTVDPIVREGKTHAALVNAFAVLTGVAAAGGVALILTAPSPARAAPKVAIRVLPALSGVTIEGVF
jgi:hypothetical protein